ncbi:phage holin family protein [Chloroflexi bacterium TSY]|nr:phage holin family protein [Chloroflexi bacterium TSY]
MNHPQKGIQINLVPIALIWTCDLISLLLMARLVPGIQVDSLFAAFMIVVLLGVIDALEIWSKLVYSIAPFETFGLESVILNGILLWFMNLLVPSITIANVWISILAALVFAVIHLIFRNLLFLFTFFRVSR